MNAGALHALQSWFQDYCRSFLTPSDEDQRNIDLKREHTVRVCQNAVWIAGELGFAHRKVMLAEAVALCHDVGRFPQYQRYKTFNDDISVNHAALGANVLLRSNALGAFPRRERELIVRSVTLHNVFSLPDGLDDETLLFSRLVRDADKLDILRVLIEFLAQEKGARAEAVALGLPDLPGYSQDVLAALRRGEAARKDALTTLNDFKLLQLAWIYDLNFPCSLRMVSERDYIRKIAQTLPGTGEIADAVGRVRDYIDGKLRGS